MDVEERVDVKIKKKTRNEDVTGKMEGKRKKK